MALYSIPFFWLSGSKDSETRAMLYEQQKKEIELQINFQRRLTILAVIITIIVFCVLSYLFLLSKQKKREIEDKNKALNDYLKSNTKLKEFAYVASHDLKSPLKAIRGMSTIVEKELTKDMDAETLKHIESINENTQKMQDLIDEVLQTSKNKKDNK